MLTLPSKQRQEALVHFDTVVSEISTKETEATRNDIQRYRRELNQLIVESISSKSKRESQDLRQKKQIIAESYKEIDRRSLGLEHFFRELGKVHEIYSSFGPQNNDIIHKLPRAYAEMLVEGQSIELLNGDKAELQSSWITSICEQVCEIKPKLRIFVLSILGLQSSGKSTLLNGLFSCKFSVSVGRCTRGLFMRLLFLNEGLRDKYNTDAILLIDTEGLGAPEKMNEKTLKRKID